MKADLPALVETLGTGIGVVAVPSSVTVPPICSGAAARTSRDESFHWTNLKLLRALELVAPILDRMKFYPDSKSDDRLAAARAGEMYDR